MRAVSRSLAGCCMCRRQFGLLASKAGIAHRGPWSLLRVGFGRQVDRPKLLFLSPCRSMASSDEGEEKKNKKTEVESSAGGNDEENDDDDEKPERLWRWFKYLLVQSAGLLIAVYVLENYVVGKKNLIDPIKIPWSLFVSKMLAKGEVKLIRVVTDSADYSKILVIHVYLYEDSNVSDMQLQSGNTFVLEPSYGGTPATVGEFEALLRKEEDKLGIPPELSIPVTYRRWSDAVAWLALTTVVALAVIAARRFGKVSSSSTGGFRLNFPNPFQQLSNLRQARYKVVDQTFDSKTPGVRFSDIAGLHEAKIEIKEVVDYLQRPNRYTRLGAKLPKGALLLGPPGCGKTLLAKAVATEANAPFFAMSGTDFIEMIGGVGAARVRDLFNTAKKRAPCIIYIDEVDAVGKKRGRTTNMMSGTSEEEQTLNQLLVEMDGLESNKGIVVLASTNRADMLDKALLRRGRFDRHIDIDLPTRLERIETFELYLQKIRLADDYKQIAVRLGDRTPGFTGADIRNVVNEAAITAATRGATLVGSIHLENALERVISGPEKKSHTITVNEKKVIAYHECGHALVGWLLEHTDALLKVTLVPRTGAKMGFAQYSPQDQKLYTKEELFDRMCMALGGRAAENVVFGRITTGAEDDLRKVTKIAYDQVQVYGMNENVGPISFGRYEEDIIRKKPFSKRLAAMIDMESSNIVVSAYRRTEDIIRKNVAKLETLAESLLEKEVLTYEDVTNLIGPPIYGAKKTTDSVESVLPNPQELETEDITAKETKPDR